MEENSCDQSAGKKRKKQEQKRKDAAKCGFIVMQGNLRSKVREKSPQLPAGKHMEERHYGVNNA
jgi:hypothetical protein